MGDRIYVGYYSGFSKGGVQCPDLGTGSLSTAASGLPVQSSIVVMGDGRPAPTYLYFNTNGLDGAGYCYSYDGGKTGSEVWATKGDNYALGRHG